MASATHMIRARQGVPFSSIMLRWNWWSVVPLALAGAAIAVPRLMSHSPALAIALQSAFSLVCHQHPDRSFFLFGGAVAVCARCLGIYLGATVGLLVRIPRQLAWHLLLAAIFISAIDWLTELAGLHGNWMLIRFGLGLALGAAAATLVANSAPNRRLTTIH